MPQVPELLQVHVLDATQNGPGGDGDPVPAPGQAQTLPGGLASAKLGKTSARPMGATLTVSRPVPSMPLCKPVAPHMSCCGLL